MRRSLSLLLLCAVASGCSDRLTPARAATVIRHSGAFLSAGSPKRSLSSTGCPRSQRRGGAESGWFRSRFVADCTSWPGRNASQTLMGSVGCSRRSPNGWAVDDVQSENYHARLASTAENHGFLFSSTSGVGASSDGTGAGVPLVHRRLAGARRPRLVHVHSPRAATPSPLPGLCMPDGGIDEDFPHVVNAVEALAQQGKVRPVIVVGISNTQRRRDLTGPTEVTSGSSDSAQSRRLGRVGNSSVRS